MPTPSARGQQHLHQVRHLRGSVDEQPTIVVDGGRGGVWFHRCNRDPLVDVAAAHDDVGVAEQVCVDRVDGADGDVVAVCLEQDRCILCQRILRGHGGR